MRNVEELRIPGELMLDAVGGENLIGSGFEEETPNPEFAPPTASAKSGER